MNDQVQHAIVEVADFLTAQWRERTPPAEALRRIGHLREKHGLELDLLWEEESFQDLVHYDALLRAEGGTFSISYCAERALPWPMRGVQRWSERDLVRVNGDLLKFGDAMASLDFIWNQARVMVPLVNHCLIRREIARRGIKVSDEQLQEAVNDFRSCRGLQTATETETWLREHGLTLERLEEHLEIEAARGELRRQLTHNALETRFADHRERYDRARVARIKLDSPSSAGRFVERATTGSKDLFEAVERASRDGDRLAAIELAVVVRGQLPDAVSAQIFAASPPPFVGPFKSGDGCDLFRVLGRMPAELDAATGDRIRDELFDEWLTERRRSAQVEWYWGQHRPC